MLANGKVTSFFRSEILFNQLAIRTPEIVQCPGKVFTHVNLPVGVGDFVNNLHGRGRCRREVAGSLSGSGTHGDVRTIVYGVAASPAFTGHSQRMV
ncbi:hypothetical protein D9M70_616240 [compost metagenome]